MLPFFRITLGVAILTAALAQLARAQDGAVHVVSYVDVMPNAVGAGAAALTHYRDATRKEAGNSRLDALQEIARPSRFALVETWKDKAAFDAHASAAAAQAFRDKIKTLADAPIDDRILNALYTGEGKASGRRVAIYVLTHVDVIPQGKDDTMTALKTMAADTAEDPGDISYQALQQANRSNHFTVIEAWADRKSLDAHAMAAHTRAFRDKVAPVAGALYDERFYKALD
jgi:quinol monooxygenase YgiN